jgi:Domain of unknown function (DUF4158)
LGAGARGDVAEDQLEWLRTFPDIGRDDLIRYFTLTPADDAFLDPGRGRGPAGRLGLAVAPATLPWLGFVPDKGAGGGGPAGGAAGAGSGGAGGVWAARAHPVGSFAAGGRVSGGRDGFSIRQRFSHTRVA